MLKKEEKGNLVVLLLAERARSEGARSTRAIEDRPGHPLEIVWKTAAALPAARRVSARRGWAGVNRGLFELPAWCFPVIPGMQPVKCWNTHIVVSLAASLIVGEP